ncbi:MAG: lipoprotein [Betaproteobacteria bacterium]
MLRQFRNVAVAIALLAVTGCGIKGPLYLAPPAAVPTSTPAPTPDAAAAPVVDTFAKPDTAKPAALPERKP